MWVADFFDKISDKSLNLGLKTQRFMVKVIIHYYKKYKIEFPDASEKEIYWKLLLGRSLKGKGGIMCKVKDMSKAKYIVDHSDSLLEFYLYYTEDGTHGSMKYCREEAIKNVTDIFLKKLPEEYYKLLSKEDTPYKLTNSL